MKTIVIDGIFFQINEWSGIAKFWRSLLSEIDIVLESTENLRVFLLVRGTARSLRQTQFRHVHQLPIAYFDPACALSHFEELGQLCQTLNADVFISSYYTLAHGVCNIGMAYDFIPEAMGWMNREGWQTKEIYMRSLSHCFSISQSTAKQASLYYPHLQSGQTDIFYPPMAAKEFEPPSPAATYKLRNDHQLNYPYMAIIGHRSDYKNIHLLTRALRQRALESQAIALGVVVTSGEDLTAEEEDLYRQHFQFGIRRLYIQSNEMAILLHQAEMLFYPSLLEGFGYPVAEALAQQCPVITTGATSIQEILVHADPGDAYLINGHNPQEALDSIIRCLHTGRRPTAATAARIRHAFCQPQGSRLIERLLELAHQLPPPRTPYLEACLSLDGLLA